MAGPTLAFGRHSSGEFLHISQAANGSSCCCTCPQCDLPLVARTEHVTPHFAHRSDAANATAGCGTTGQMTALHTFARDLFLDGGRVQLPSVSQEGHCLLNPVEVELTDVRTEQRFDGYQPDVIFTALDRPLLMEIAVKHPVPFLKAGLIRRQRVEAFEIAIKPGSVPGTMPLVAVENHVRRVAPRRWIFNEVLERHLQALYHLDGVQARGALTSQKSKNLVRLYDRLSELPKTPVPALAAKKELLSEWLSDAHPSFEGYFRTSSLDWRTFVLLELGGLGLPLRRIVRSLKAAQHLHLELTDFDCSEPEAAEAGLPAFGVEACVFTFLSELEQRGAVVCLGGIWRLLVELPRQQAQPFGPVAQRPTRAELVAKRRNEVKATLQRIVAKLDAADRDEFESDIKEWWTCPLFGRSTPLDIISVGNYQWERLKKQLAAIENALNSDTPDLGEPLGLPMSAAIAAHAARAAILETERGLRRCEGLRAKALQKFDAEVAEIWLATRPFQKGQSPLEHAMASDSGLKTSLEALERRFVHRGSIPVIREDFQVWVTKKFGNRGLRFIHRRNDGLPDRRTPLQCCYDEVSLAGMRELTLRAAPFT
ncbi:MULTISPECIES: hypothetical protein [unclassified Rhizobium]|uniref:hypothetical protein n=2 Tax=Rhizobium TaxID=379 RepID=UPI000BD5EC08|nr:MULTISPECIES: hypothetical protein [unclassified Rhizobium]MDH7809440.1 hypothetical protein [Rhizobium sp. AN67]SOD50304.1 hypothetical protein SAMN05216595_0093 [Rhizobium sp. AN6A]